VSLAIVVQRSCWNICAIYVVFFNLKKNFGKMKNAKKRKKKYMTGI